MRATAGPGKAHHEKWCEEIIRLLSCPGCTSLALNNLDLRIETIVFLVEQLNQYPTMTMLNLCTGNLKDNAAIELAKLEHVKNLDVSNNAIGSAGATALLQNPHFTTLDLSNSDFYDDAPNCDHQKLLRAVLENHTLKELSVERSGLTPEMRQQIAAHFKEKKLPSLLNGCGFEYAGEKLDNNSVLVSDGITPAPSPTNGHHQ